MWFLNHDHFKRWLEQDSGPLLVTADPGCGKSVLAKYLVDYILPQSTSTVCYFFFKQQDQNTMRQALCALLHQLFSTKPALIEHAIQEYRINGKGLINSTGSLWKILYSAITDTANSGSTIIVLDALDECAESEFEDLVRNVKRQFSDNQIGNSRLKYLLTCRPYEQIMSKFRSLLSTFPNIRIPGEEESDTISSEVDRVITHQIGLLSRDKLLSDQVKSELETRLKQTTNRTYLWVYLIFDYLRNEDFKKTPQAIISIVMTLPRTVNEAYSQILSKSKNDVITGKALRIVLAACQPLTVSEMNIAVNIDFESTHNIDLEDDKDFETRIRSCCGLFISIYHGKIFLLHQTAREFLIDTALSTAFPTATSPKLLWHRSITMRNAHAIFAEICVFYLNLFNSGATPSDSSHSSHTNDNFLDYSAKFWNAHFHEANITGGDAIIPVALKISNPISKSYHKWFEIYLTTTKRRRAGEETPQVFTDVLLVAAYCGNRTLVKVLLDQGARIEVKDARYYRTPLCWASLSGQEAVVKLLLEADAELCVKDAYCGWTPLLCATVAEHKTIVKTLLDKGADIEAKDSDNRTSLLWASLSGHEALVQLLLDHGADIEAKDARYGWTPLSWAARNWHGEVVKLLLERGANFETRDHNGRTPLLGVANLESYTTPAIRSSDTNEDNNLLNHIKEGSYGIFATEYKLKDSKTVAMLLLEKGADIEARDSDNRTSLLWASSSGHETLVQLLLDNGADIEASDQDNRTPLLLAALSMHKDVAWLLLNKGADIEAKDHDNWTPLSWAALRGHESMVKLLLKNGAKVKAKGNSNWTPLSWAALCGHEAIVKLLLENGAGVEMKEDANQTPLSLARCNSHWAIIDLLLRHC